MASGMTEAENAFVLQVAPGAQLKDHRGEIIVHLKHAKMAVDRELTYAIWEWVRI